MTHPKLRSLFILAAALLMLPLGLATTATAQKAGGLVLLHPIQPNDPRQPALTNQPSRTCPTYDPSSVVCGQNGGYTVTLHGAFTGAYVPEQLDISSLTPGVTVSPNHLSPAPANPQVTLTGASVGQTVTLMINGAKIGSGAVKGSDLCCLNLVRVQIPRKTCDTPAKPDLAIKKELVGRCTPTRAATGHTCRIRVTITNVGTAPWFGPLSVTDTFGASGATIYGQTPPWTCVGSSPTSCNRPPLTLNPGQSDTLAFSMHVPGHYNGGRFRECVSTEPHGIRGNVTRAQTLLNSLGYNAGRVDGQAGAQTRAAVRQCQAQNGQPQTGNYRDFLSFMALSYSTDPNLQNNQACININLSPLPKRCPQGTIGTWPNCRKIIPKQCPKGTIGTWPNCRKIVLERCPQGTIGNWPNCIKIPTCPRGTVGIWPNCQSIIQRRCAPGTIGTWPNCRKAIILR